MVALVSSGLRGGVVIKTVHRTTLRDRKLRKTKERQEDEDVRVLVGLCLRGLLGWGSHGCRSGALPGDKLRGPDVAGAW